MKKSKPCCPPSWCFIWRSFNIMQAFTTGSPAHHNLKYPDAFYLTIWLFDDLNIFTDTLNQLHKTDIKSGEYSQRAHIHTHSGGDTHTQSQRSRESYWPGTRVEPELPIRGHYCQTLEPKLPAVHWLPTYLPLQFNYKVDNMMHCTHSPRQPLTQRSDDSWQTCFYTKCRCLFLSDFGSGGWYFWLCLVGLIEFSKWDDTVYLLEWKCFQTFKVKE